MLPQLLGKSYSSLMKPQTFEHLKSSISQFKSENDKKELTEYAEELKTQIKQFDILHDYYVRTKLNKIETHLTTIKTIVIICFVLSIIVGVIIGFSTI